MKALMSLQEEQEEYILKTQREKQELKQEMEAKSRALEEAQRQLEEVRANRHRVDQDVVVRGALSVHLGQTGLVGFMRKQVCKKTTGSSLCRFGMRHSPDVAGSSLGFLSRYFCSLSPTGCSEETSPGEHQRQALERPDEQAHAADWTRRCESHLDVMNLFKCTLNMVRLPKKPKKSSYILMGNFRKRRIKMI